MLDALEATGGERWKPLRPRIEHGDMFAPAADADRAKRMGVIVVQNPSHFMLPQYMTPRLGPERLKRTTTVKAIVESGVPFALESDGPMNPFLNIMFATINANNPSQALTVAAGVEGLHRGFRVGGVRRNEQGRDSTRHAGGRGAPLAGHLCRAAAGAARRP